MASFQDLAAHTVERWAEGTLQTVLGVVAIAMGVNARSEVHERLAEQKITGTPDAAATCITPLSAPMNRSAFWMTPASSLRVVFLVRSIGVVVIAYTLATLGHSEEHRFAVSS